jgi:hypothetical protein
MDVKSKGDAALKWVDLIVGHVDEDSVSRVAVLDYLVEKISEGKAAIAAEVKARVDDLLGAAKSEPTAEG